MDKTTPTTKPRRPDRDANSSSREAKRRARARAQLATLEEHVRGYEKARLKAARALRTIRNDELYAHPHTAHRTFELYVENTYDFTVRNAQHLIRFADRADEFVAAGTVPPVTSAQIRALGRLPEADRIPTWVRLVAEHGSAAAITAPMIDACGPATDSGPGKAVAQDERTRAEPATTPLQLDSAAMLSDTTDDGPVTALAPDAGTGPSSSTVDWPTDALKALRQVPKAHRNAVATEVNTFADEVEGGEVEAWMVEETADGYGAAVLEDGLDASAESGASVDAVVSEESAAGTVDSPILSLDILPEPGLVHPRKFKCSTLFLGTDERTPLLVSLPRDVVPVSLAADVRPDAKTIVVELGELERRGGPVRKGVLDLTEIRAAALAVGIVTLIQSTNEHVDWARRTVNPVTGCQHACRITFCYAAGIARRLFAQAFLPTLHPARLDAFGKTPLAKVAGLSDEAAWRERSVFVVSMGDLFGKWIPRWYRQAVLNEIRLNPGWFCFLLTKDPSELAGLDFPPNCAVGLTITDDEDTTREAQQRRYRKYAEALSRVEGAAILWLSIEPFRGEIYDLQPFFDAGVTMVAIGGQSRTVLAPLKAGEKLIVVPAMQPEIRWVEQVRAQCYRAGIEPFEKENLTVKPKHIPWPTGRPGA